MIQKSNQYPKNLVQLLAHCGDVEGLLVQFYFLTIHLSASGVLLLLLLSAGLLQPSPMIIFYDKKFNHLAEIAFNG